MYEVPSGRVVWFKTSPNPGYGKWRLGVVYVLYGNKQYEIRTLEGRRYTTVSPQHVVLRLGEIP